MVETRHNVCGKYSKGFCGLSEEPSNLRGGSPSDSCIWKAVQQNGTKGLLISNTAPSVVRPINRSPGISLWQLSEHNLKRKKNAIVPYRKPTCPAPMDFFPCGRPDVSVQACSKYVLASLHLITYKYPFSFIAGEGGAATLTGFAAVLRLNAGDKERRLQGSSNVHPHATWSGQDPQRLRGWVACLSICCTGTEHQRDGVGEGCGEGGGERLSARHDKGDKRADGADRQTCTGERNNKQRGGGGSGCRKAGCAWKGGAIVEQQRWRWGEMGRGGVKRRGGSLK